MKQHTVYLGIGSNSDAEIHIRSGVAELIKKFGYTEISSVYLSEAIGIKGPPFLNLVIAIKTNLALVDLIQCLKAIEACFGRTKKRVKFSPITLDIDVLAFDDYCGNISGVVLPRPEIFEYAHVLCPFAELAPALVLPNCQYSLAKLWRQQDVAKQSIDRVNFNWAEALAG